MRSNSTSKPPPAAPVDGRRLLPVDRVFVVRFEDGAAISGEVEHVLSGHQRCFGNPAELLMALSANARIPNPETKRESDEK